VPGRQTNSATSEVAISGQRTASGTVAPAHPELVELEGREVPFALLVSKRSRRLRLRLDADPFVKIVTPVRCPPLEIADLLRPHSRWIFDHLDRLTEASTGRLEHGSAVPFVGGELVLELATGKPSQVSVQGRFLRVTSPSLEEREIAKILRTWYRKEAASKFRERAEHWSDVLGIKSLRLTVRDQRTRWGSCSARGALSFSWRLMLAPPEVLDYVVLHEVAHLREHNHSKQFWAIVSEHCPEYQSHRKWLRREGPALTGFLR
jgi:predicted metal-dependent hydrolase